jgi:hypothetical protein
MFQTVTSSIVIKLLLLTLIGLFTLNLFWAPASKQQRYGSAKPSSLHPSNRSDLMHTHVRQTPTCTPYLPEKIIVRVRCDFLLLMLDFLHNKKRNILKMHLTIIILFAD